MRAAAAALRSLAVPCEPGPAAALLRRAASTLRLEAAAGLLWMLLSGSALAAWGSVLGPVGSAVLLLGVAAGSWRLVSRLLAARRAERLAAAAAAGMLEDVCGRSLGDLLGV